MPVLATTRVVREDRNPRQWVFFLHGIYGAGRNWASVARRLVEECPEWGCLLVDLRLHGNSKGFGPPHTVKACARDVATLAAVLGLNPDAMLGHSFGGKVALQFAALEGVGPRQLWVVDSTPAALPPEGSAVQLLEALRSLPGPFGSREEVVTGLQTRGFSPLVAGWVATNLEKQDGTYLWRFDLDSWDALLADFFATDLWSIAESPPEGTEVHFVKAAGSTVLDPETSRRLEAAGVRNGCVTVHLLEGGHWLNVDNPGGLVALLAEHLRFNVA